MKNACLLEEQGARTAEEEFEAIFLGVRRVSTEHGMELGKPFLPKICTPSRLPFSLRERLQKELDTHMALSTVISECKKKLGSVIIKELKTYL